MRPLVLDPAFHRTYTLLKDPAAGLKTKEIVEYFRDATLMEEAVGEELNRKGRWGNGKCWPYY